MGAQALREGLQESAQNAGESFGRFKKRYDDVLANAMKQADEPAKTSRDVINEARLMARATYTPSVKKPGGAEREI